MATAEKKFEFGELRCDSIPASEAVKLVFKIGRIAAPLLKNISGVKLESLIADTGTALDGSDTANRNATLAAISGFMSELDELEAFELVQSMCERCQVRQPQGNYEPLIFDSIFEGNPLASLEVAWWVFSTQFGNFFDGKSPAQ